MKRVMYTSRRFLQVLLEELIALDRRTDFTKMALRYVSLNDDDLYDDDDDDDADSSEEHFGVVSAALALAALPFICKGLSFIILILQALH